MTLGQIWTCGKSSKQKIVKQRLHNEVSPLDFVNSRIRLQAKFNFWRLKMKQHYYDEKTGIPDVLVGDYYLA